MLRTGRPTAPSRRRSTIARVPRSSSSTTARPSRTACPHYGHLLTGYAKDVVPRFETMRGKQVHRRFGWDTHGLPAELEAERILGITDKSPDRRDGHRRLQRGRASRVGAEVHQGVGGVRHSPGAVGGLRERLQDARRHLHGVRDLWAFKQLYDKGLAYEGYRVLPYCWRDETPLSNHELRMDDDVYQMRQDPALTVLLPLVPDAVAGSGWMMRPRRRSPTQPADLDDDPVDPAEQPRRGGGAGDRVLGRASPPRARSPDASWCWPPRRVAAYARELGADGRLGRRAPRS